MEEAPFLVAVQRVVGGVEIEGDLLGRRGVRLHEEVDEQRLDGRPVVAYSVIARWLGPAQLQPVQRRLAGHRRAVPSFGFQLARQHRHHRIVAQLVVVEQVLVAERDAQHTLADQRRHRVLDQLGAASILETCRQAADQPNRPVRRSKQQRPSVRRDPPAVKRRHHRPSFDRCKAERIRVTLCRHRGVPPVQLKSLSQNNFR